jgi:hypothetical protein
MLQTVGNRLELVGRLFGERGARALRTQKLRIVKRRAQNGEVLRLREFVDVELILCGDLVGPTRLDAKRWVSQATWSGGFSSAAA